MQKGFTVDLNRCTGCQACMVACSIENALPIDTCWRSVLTYNEPRHANVPVFHLSLACNHCADPACLRGCPSVAYTKDPVTGAVTLDNDRCIGCRYCMWMCPYDAPQFSEQHGTVHKCTFCNDRLHQGLDPACVTCCPTDALAVGDTNGQCGPASAHGFPTTRLDPAIAFVPLRLPDQRDFASQESVPIADRVDGRSGATIPSKVSLQREWTLLIFTFLAPVLVAWFAARVVADVSVSFSLYVTLGIGAIGLSTLHLGRPTRAYRAVLNWRQSWLSREVIFFSAFLALSSLILATSTESAFANSIIIVGLAALCCMDMVYHAAATTKPVLWHSASVMLTGAYLFAMFASIGWLAWIVGGTKAVLYLRRHMPHAGARNSIRPMVLATIRLTLGFLIPMLCWSISETIHLVLIVSCLIAELIDRAEFYHDLEIITPRRQIAVELQQSRRAM